MFKGKKSTEPAAAPPPPSAPSPAPNITSGTSTPPTGAGAISHPASSQLGGSGLLLIRIVEARNLVYPNGGAAVQIGTGVGADITRLPYCVIDFDKNEIMVPAKEGNPGSRTVVWGHRANFDVSREAEVTISVLQRGTTQGQDVLLGSVRVKPLLIDGKLQDQWYPLQSDGEGAPTVAGELHLQFHFKKQVQNKSLTIDDFELLKVIGKGSFGKVMQVRKRDTNRIYAMKILRKSHIVERAEVAHTLAERTVLAKLNHPFIVPLKFSFQTPDKLYLVLAFVNGGELFHHLQKEGRFTEDRARFYVAELLCALECLHGYNIIYRDLKPENILLDFTGHIALCDFGLCKLNMKDGNKTNTFCGTPEYLAPELLLGQGYTKVVDWWTIGILLYEMITGLPPFYDENTNEMYKKILGQELVFPDDVSPVARDLLSQLLDRDPTRRLGTTGADAIKRHPFFSETNWSRLLARKIPPPFRPNVLSATDTSNFDEEFTSEIPQDSLVEGSAHLGEDVQSQFVGFSYQAHEGIAGSLGGGVNGGSLVVGGKMGGAAGVGVGSLRQAGGTRRGL
ncbi:kinase-like domain-containing protein [Fimicolochytrium jonesii]|uniref:kinase-like domain-containing protein n=1 Tax=Fimicolochytrium jonesii TaxID=1396493 RepID=UPI0022FF3583|nr:kinase-like domain-containing protein [Fimicolochytrium jonesii]KAI8816583.1 kinase-like domain-containing protein [Fimicolochytrium jonesii]